MSITRDDLRALHKRYLDAGKGPTASQAHTWIKTMWAWLLETDKIESDQLAPVKLKLPRPQRTGVYTDAEIVAIWQAAYKLAGYSPERAIYTYLMVLLTPRKTALAMMRWSDLDPDMKVWTTPDQYVKRALTAKPSTYRTPLPTVARKLMWELE